MVGERLFDKVLSLFSALVLSSAVGCAAVNKSMKLQLDEKGTVCEVVHAERKAEVMKCGEAEYTLKKKGPDKYVSGTIVRLYERKEGARTYQARTDWYEDRRCPVSMDIDLENGAFHVEFDENCNAWGIKKVKEVPTEF